MSISVDTIPKAYIETTRVLLPSDFEFYLNYQVPPHVALADLNLRLENNINNINQILYGQIPPSFPESHDMDPGSSVRV